MLKQLRNEPRPELLCYVLNTAQKRELIDSHVHSLDGNVLAYKHDGLFLEFEGNLGLLRNEIKSGEFAFTLKPQLTARHRDDHAPHQRALGGVQGPAGRGGSLAGPARAEEAVRNMADARRTIKAV